MGLAVLPSRLKKEIAVLEQIITDGGSLYENESISSHIDWAAKFLPKYGYKVDEKGVVIKPEETGEEKPTATNGRQTVRSILQNEIGYVFAGVLEDAGVYKRNQEGINAFIRFIDTL
jgi:UDPglucose--hexose-1-phosphate uridylyltransferase